MDEFMRLRSLESIAIAAAVTAGVTFTYGFLEGAGFPEAQHVLGVGGDGLTWGLVACLRCLVAR